MASATSAHKEERQKQRRTQRAQTKWNESENKESHSWLESFFAELQRARRARHNYCHSLQWRALLVVTIYARSAHSSCAPPNWAAQFAPVAARGYKKKGDTLESLVWASIRVVKLLSFMQSLFCHCGVAEAKTERCAVCAPSRINSGAADWGRADTESAPLINLGTTTLAPT